MKKSIHIACIPLLRLLVVALLALAQIATAADSTNHLTRSRVADTPEVRDALIKLDIWLEGQRMKHDLPGFSAGVVHDQELIWSKGYGYADVTNRIPATEQTLYRVASITKTFTATAVMQLVEQGKLSLEDPVNQRLTWFVPQGADPAQPIRVWNLLSHTAGLLREAPGTDWDEFRSPDAAELRTATPTTPLSTPTQTRIKYSNYGFAVAGELVAQASGIPYADYLRERILKPLGMTNSLLLDSAEAVPGLAVPYGRRLPGRGRVVERQIEEKALLPAGGLVSNVRDLAKWASLQFNEADEYRGPVLTGRSLREMHRPRFLVPDWSLGYGLGWWLNRGEKRAEIEHTGGLPGYKSKLLMDPTSKVAVIVLINAEDAPRNLARGVMKLIAAPFAKAAAAPDPAAAAETDLAQFEGLYYWHTSEYVRVVVLGGKLRLIDLNEDDVEKGTTTLRRTGPNAFLTEHSNEPTNDEGQSVIEFRFDPTGRAISFTEHNGAYRFHRVDEPVKASIETTPPLK
jgi:D-alanyl-D-alanine carboxypeptidase